MRRGHRPSQALGGRIRFWGRHAVTAALANPERNVRKLWGTREAVGPLKMAGDVVREPVRLETGTLRASDLPGLGADVDADAVARYRMNS